MLAIIHPTTFTTGDLLQVPILDAPHTLTSKSPWCSLDPTLTWIA